MIARVIEFSARNRLLVLALALAAAAVGAWAGRSAPLDAIPDLSDTQVIIYSRWDRSPDLVEDQVTYPIVSAMLGAPGVRVVRGFSDFGYSFVYVLFEDGTDIYWARSRVLEYLSSVLARLPEGVKTELGPDATGLGWVYQYALVDRSGRHDLAELRSIQDFYLRYHLKAVPGVAEVAPLGGFGRQYQVQLDPERLRARGLSIGAVSEAVRGGNVEASGRLIEIGGAEYMIRGRGYVKSAGDLEEILVGESGGAPVRIKDVGRVVLGPELRRGAADLDGQGEVVSGIVVMRQGMNALDVIDRVKAKLAEVRPGLPEGVEIVTGYDRSDLIRRAIANLRGTLVEVIITVALVILLFLRHPPSALIPVVTIPITVLIAFIPFKLAGVTANIMSLGGIAIAIGALVDAAIVVVEQTHKRLEERASSNLDQDDHKVILDAIKEVAGPSFYALLVLGASFLPVLALESQEGRLFTPLAVTKTLCMVTAALLAITLDPALRLLLTRVRRFDFRPKILCRAANAALVGRIRPEEEHPLSRALIRLYTPIVGFALRRKWAVLGGAIALMAATVPLWSRLGSEFMPPLAEGSLLYMPSTLPPISITEAKKLLAATDRVLAGFPEVERVLGKCGRAETPTDPAPLSMLETVITLKPREAWRKVPTWYSSFAPPWLAALLRHVTPDHISEEQLVAEMNAALSIPGVSNAWTMPVKGRIDMLTTGVRTAVGLKIAGTDPRVLDEIGARIEALLPSVPGTRSVFAERSAGGYYVDIEWDRAELAKAGLGLSEAQEAVSAAIGGEDVTVTVEGRARYPVSVRLLSDFRADVEAIARVPVPAQGGARQVPLGQLAKVHIVPGPAMLRSEDGLLTGYVYVDLAGIDPGRYVDAARERLRDSLRLPPGYSVAWTGQYEAIERVRERLGLIVPATLFLIFFLVYLNTRSLAKTAIVLLAVPFSAIGALWLLYLLGYHVSAAVWVGLIALLGVDAETGIFMLLYLDLAWERARREGRLGSREELRVAIVAGAARRLRPKLMTVATMFLGLVPIMWSSGAGSDVMKRIAAPMIGGIFTSFLLELLVYPGIYEIWKWDLARRVDKVPPLADD